MKKTDRSKFFLKLQELDFYETYCEIEELISEEEECVRNKINMKLDKLPKLYNNACKLLIISKQKFDESLKEYEYYIAKLNQKIRNELEQKKKRKEISTHISAELVNQQVLLKHKEEIDELKDNLNNQELIVKSCEYLIKSIDTKRSVLQTISKNLEISASLLR